MSDNGFPDLSKWHKVPEGVKIPAGVRYAAKWSDGSVSVGANIEVFTPTSNVPHVTEKPIPKPDALVELLGSQELADKARAIILAESEPAEVWDRDGDRWTRGSNELYICEGDDFSPHTRHEVDMYWGPLSYTNPNTTNGD